MKGLIGKIESILSNFFRGLTEKSDRKRATQVTGDNVSEKYLDIPLIGGPMYIISRYSHALKFNRLIEEEKIRSDMIRKDIREEYSITNSIRRQLEEYQIEGGTVSITVKREHSVYFMETLREFPSIACADLGGGEYVLSTIDEI